MEPAALEAALDEAVLFREVCKQREQLCEMAAR
jgi:hypothetical protein